jgi:hypothetical protein
MVTAKKTVSTNALSVKNPRYNESSFETDENEGDNLNNRHDFENLEMRFRSKPGTA